MRDLIVSRCSGYWPLQMDDQTGVSDYLNRVSKFVVSRTLKDPQWEHTTVLRGALVDEIQALKMRPGRDIGRGQRLFADAIGVASRRLVECRAFRSGIVLLRYRSI